MAVSRPIFKLTPSDWSTSWWRAPPSENQFDNPSKFMVPMLLNFPEDSWVAIDNLTKDRSQFCLRNFPRSCIRYESYHMAILWTYERPSGTNSTLGHFSRQWVICYALVMVKNLQKHLLIYGWQWYQWFLAQSVSQCSLVMRLHSFNLWIHQNDNIKKK